MSCINRTNEDVITISRMEDTSVREFGERIKYLGDEFIVYYISEEIIKAVKLVDKRQD